MKKLVIILFTITMILSCRAKKAIVTEQIVENIEDKKVKEVVEKHYENTTNFTTLSIKSNADFQNPKQSLSVNADIRIKKDEIIWINLKFFGIPMAKAIITPTRVSFYEKAGNTFFDGDYSYISRLLGTDLDYSKVENLILGKPIDDLTKEDLIMELSENFILLKNKIISNTEKSFSFENGNYLLKKQFINQSSQNRNVLINYNAYSKVDNMFFPNGFTILANNKEEVRIDIEYKKIKLNENLTFPYEIPDGYKNVDE